MLNVRTKFVLEATFVRRRSRSRSDPVDRRQVRLRGTIHAALPPVLAPYRVRPGTTQLS